MGRLVGAEWASLPWEGAATGVREKAVPWLAR